MAEAKETSTAIDAMHAAIKAAYDRGYVAGRSDALNLIMKAANETINVRGANHTNGSSQTADERSKNERAPRGAVRQAVTNMLKTVGDKGATTSEIISRVQEFSDGIELNGLSASNELQRQKGKLYLQDSDGYWHLIAKTVQNEKPADENTLAGPSTGLFS